MSHLRVRHVADVNPACPAWDRLPDDADLTFVPLEAVWPRRVDMSRVRPKAETSSGYTRFQQGDVIVPKITPTFEADRSTWVEHVPTVAATGTTELHVVRARPGVEPRYLDHLFSSASFLRGGEAEMIGVAGQKRVPDSWLRDFPVPIVDHATQRAVADYLDAETTRIDALIAKKQQLIHLLEERLTIEVETVIRQLGYEYGLAPLKHSAGPITVGIVITPASWYMEQGVPAIRGVNVSPGHIDMTDAVFLSREGHEANSKSTLRGGDLVVVRTGQAGAAAVVPSDLDGANCIDLLIVRAAPGVRSRFLEYVLNSDWTIKHIGEHSVGSIQAHFNVASLRDVPVPTPPVEIQDNVVMALDKVTVRHRAMISSLTRQLELLAEHRQALITATVTGEFAVPRAA